MWLNFVRSAERDMQMKMQSIAIIVEQKVQVRKKAITVTSIHYVFFHVFILYSMAIVKFTFVNNVYVPYSFL